MTPEETIMNAVPSAHTPAPTVERVLEISDRVDHSGLGSGVVVTIVPSAYDVNIETYIGVMLDNGDTIRVPQSQLRYIASNAEPHAFGPEHDAPPIVSADGFELDAKRTEAMQRSEVRRKREAKRVAQDDPKRVVKQRKGVTGEPLTVAQALEPHRKSPVRKPKRKSNVVTHPQTKKRVGGLKKIGAKGKR